MRNCAGKRAVSILLVAGTCAAAPVSAPDPAFEARWRDGRAELDGYRLKVNRYGAPRTGRAVLVYVTEPFSARARVKLDRPELDPRDVVDVLKLNVVRDFQTGIYDYNTMVSTFVRTDNLKPLKVSFTSTEWCGNVYAEMRLDPHRITEQVFSYFEGESGVRTIDWPAGGLLEDELLIRLRGLHGEWMRSGERKRVPFLAGAFWRRLAHRRADWTSATIERLAAPERIRVPAGTFATIVYVVRAADGREGRFHVEAADPHRIVRWEWIPPGATGQGRGLGGTDRGELTGSRRLAYWKLHDPGDERYLDSLGIGPAAP